MNFSLVSKILTGIDPDLEVISFGLTSTGYSLVYVIHREDEEPEEKTEIIRIASDLNQFYEKVKDLTKRQ